MGSQALDSQDLEGVAPLLGGVAQGPAAAAATPRGAAADEPSGLQRDASEQRGGVSRAATHFVALAAGLILLVPSAHVASSYAVGKRGPMVFGRAEGVISEQAYGDGSGSAPAQPSTYLGQAKQPPPATWAEGPSSQPAQAVAAPPQPDSSIEGNWMTKDNHPAVIESGVIKWYSGETSLLGDVGNGVYMITLDGNQYSVRRDGDHLLWSDGDIWMPGQAAPGVATDTSAASPAPEAAPAAQQSPAVTPSAEGGAASAPVASPGAVDSGAAQVADGSCQDAFPWTAAVGEDETGCTAQVVKAMLNDVFETPNSFPGLTSDSCFEEFQAFLAKNESKRRGKCPKPCATPCQLPTASVEASVMQGEGAQCPPCSPQVAQAPDVVIPFFERDMCKLKYTVKSIMVHDPDHHLGSIILMWVSKHPPSKYQKDLDEIKALVVGREVKLLDYSPQVEKIDGWFVQQILKLKVAAEAQTDYYLVLDAKNTFLEDVTPDTFFTSCNQAKIPAEYASLEEVPAPHQDWFKTAERLLHTTAPGVALWPTSITPIVLHRQTVLDMLALIGEKVSPDPLCQGPICYMFGCGFNTDGKVFATEFTTYLMYAYSKIQTTCVHAVQQVDKTRSWALSLWRGVPETVDEVREENLEHLRGIVSGALKPLSFGGQPDSLRNTSMSSSQMKEAQELLVQIFLDANVVDADAVGADSLDDFLKCVV